MGLTDFAISMLSSAPTALTQCNIANVEVEFPDSRRWVNKLGMMTVFQGHLRPEARLVVLRFLGKIQMALSEYSAARREVEDHITNTKRWGSYYRALHHAEMAAALMYQGHDILRKFGKYPIFESGDGSAMQRLNEIYNTGKHEPPLLADTVVLGNQGLRTAQGALTYAEIEELLRESGKICERLLQTTPPESAVDA